MEKAKLIKIIKIVAIGLIIFFSISVFISSERIKEYKVTTLYEDLSLSEKVASTISGVHFYTKDEAISQGIIFSDTKQEAHNIGDIFTPITEFMGKNDGANTQLKIERCELALKELHEENESGRVEGSDLISLMNNCINAVENYKSALKAKQNSNASEYKNYSDKMIESYRNATNDLERLNKQ